MQVGRVYGLIVLVLVLLVVVALFSWGRVADDDTPIDGDMSISELEDSGIDGIIIPDIEDGDTEYIPSNPSDVPPEVRSDNPYIPSSSDSSETTESNEGDLLNNTTDSEFAFTEEETSTEEETTAEETAPTDDIATQANDSTEDLYDNTDLPTSARKYTVKSGDILGSISQKVYGNAKYWRKIAKANNITGATVLKIGQVLIIPELPKNSTPAKATASTSTETTTTTGNKYKVKSGDTLQKISYKFFKTIKLWRKIAAANNLNGSSVLRIGQVLIIPEVKTSTSSTSTSVSSKDDTPASTANGKTYTVVSGDNLWNIAKKVYKNANLWKVIYNANKNTIPASKKLKIGMVLVIPEVKTTKQAVKETTPKAASSENKPNNSSISEDAQEEAEEEVISFF